MGRKVKPFRHQVMFRKEITKEQNFYTYVVPERPWPQSFYVSKEILTEDAVELRPLTVTGLLKGISRNFITMNIWRIAYLMYLIGFYDLKDGEYFDVKALRWKFWETLKKRKARRVAMRILEPPSREGGGDTQMANTSGQTK